MVESNVVDLEGQIAKILALFYEDEPLKAYRMLLELQSTHGDIEGVKKFT